MLSTPLRVDLPNVQAIKMYFIKTMLSMPLTLT